jgi:multimeric flavodoxin WrbA
MLKINFGTDIGKKMLSILPKTAAKTRRLNLDIFNEKSEIFSFFNGWISTDGSMRENGNIHLYNVSYDCLRDAQLLLSRVGIKSNISDISHVETMVRNKKHIRTSCLTISDQESVRTFCENSSLLHTKKRNLLQKGLSVSKRTLKHQYSKVKSIKEVGYRPVYDIEVSNSHEFNCEGIKIHNCSCYFKGDEKKPDLLKELDVYTLLQECDAFLVFSPIHWHSLSSQIKTLFDRLVCVNQTLTVDDAKKIMGDGNIKNADITGKFARSGTYDNMLRNHLEGKVCGFYAHGDDGADDYEGKNLPESYNDVLVDNFSIDPKSVVMPFVLQMKYSGVFVPDELIQAFYMNKGVDYNTANKELRRNKEPFERAVLLMENLMDYLDKNNQ